MAELTNVVNELIKGKRVGENLHVYCEGLSSLYRRMAELRLAMNYFTFSEIYRELDDITKSIIEPSVNRIQKLINDITLLEEAKKSEDNMISEIKAFRKELTGKMEILTSYTDRFQIVEYVLNRVEFRYKTPEFSEDYYQNKFEGDIFRYVISDRDNSVINSKLANVIAQIPMRLSKNKFYDLIRDAFSIYKGSEKQTVDDFSYMVRTDGALYVPEGFETEFSNLRSYYEELYTINVEQLDKEQYEKYRNLLDCASDLIEKYSDFYVMITEVLNDLYSIVLNLDALADVNESDKLKDIISAAYDYIEGHDVEMEKVSEKFVLFEGLQEKISSKIFNPESALEEILSINEEYINNSDYLQKINDLLTTSKLQSASTFAKLECETDKKQEADETYIDEIVNGIINDFSALFENMDRPKRRAVMATVISSLPVFFNNLEEFKKYVHVALSQCNDSAEKQACMALINLMITDE